ncbi:sigma-54-dependent Fis family transcriptional regulator [candidate division KSB1 bacterium]|nr:sigma-54-dependent Fis family transcriptional regulator [candidate division KSB1 bacterium]NIR68477.1 sigma-54-dependent Fis family transcriptional regulator [candidate division KSB1 bacterium]NIS22491.1 sigma-54-dependent Fis family transcriptional regulator [candidate division KSB1 bacterium]NIT69335.1 sigma-54-dependent Fis family transcriptional regulator [candidate division KSB1 bacterium]NIU22996.1 sigma-54-dependent Fis family transcriptional regulator [candidate division KSB1 bacteri
MRAQFEQMVGKSPAMRQVYHQIRKAADTDIHILLMGETGTGKDLAAQAIHRRSDRSTKPFVATNLAALPSGLVASELFGHERGAFTGAMGRHRGVFEQGDQGTVFLDEIDTLDEGIQVSLLRLIEQKQFCRLGGRETVSNRARIIAATNQNLQERVRQGKFREDLFYRLDVFRISIPPLRERPEDIPLLIEEFIRHFNGTFQKNIQGMPAETIRLLQANDWPGNVRELKNVVQRAMLVCEDGTILPEHLPPRFRSASLAQPSITIEIGTSLDDVEKEFILATLRATNNNRTQAAQLLGMSRRAIYNKLGKHNIQ